MKNINRIKLEQDDRYAETIKSMDADKMRDLFKEYDVFWDDSKIEQEYSESSLPRVMEVVFDDGETMLVNSSTQFSGINLARAVRVIRGKQKNARQDVARTISHPIFDREWAKSYEIK